MSEAKYTVTEIDEMRAAIRVRLLPTGDGIVDLTGFNERVETQLRTYMLNGTRPKELPSCVMSENWLGTDVQFDPLEQG